MPTLVGVSRIFVVLFVLVLLAGCDKLARPEATDDDAARDAGDAASDAAPTDGTDPSVEPDWPVELLDASVWTEAQIADAVAACEAWHAAQPAPPAPDVVLDCAAGDCALDVPWVRPPREAWVGVELTLDGEALHGEAWSYNDFGLVLLAEGGDGGRSLERVTSRRYDAFVPHGVYDLVLWSRHQRPGLPWGRLVLAEELVVDGDMATPLQLDLGEAPSIELVAHARLDGEPPPPVEGGHRRGDWGMMLEPLAFPSLLQGPDIGALGPEVTLRVFPGTYAVAIAPGPSSGTCLLIEHDAPCGYERIDPRGYAVVHEALELVEDTELVLEARSAQLGGAVRSSAPLEHVSLDLFHALAPFEGPRWGDGEHGFRSGRQVEVVDGRYALEAWQGRYTVSAAPLLEPLADGVVLGEDAAVLDLDLRTARVELEVTLDGAAWPDATLVAETLERPILGYSSNRERSAALRGASRVELELFPSTWSVALEWPAGRLALAAPLALGPDTRAYLDAHHSRAPMRVALDGPAPRSAGRELELVAPWAGIEQSLAAPATEDRFAGHVVAGVYDLVLDEPDYGAQLVARCQPVTGVEPVRLEPVWRELRVRAVDTQGIALARASIVVRALDVPGAPAVVLSPRGDALEVPVRLVPGRYSIGHRDTAASLVVEVR